MVSLNVDSVINLKREYYLKSCAKYTIHKARHFPSFFAAANDGGAVMIGGKPIDNIWYKASDFDE